MVAEAAVAAATAAKEAAEGTLALRDVQVGSVIAPKLNAVKMEARVVAVVLVAMEAEVKVMYGMATHGILLDNNGTKQMVKAVKADPTVLEVKAAMVVMAEMEDSGVITEMAAPKEGRVTKAAAMNMIAVIAAIDLVKAVKAAVLVAFALELGLEAVLAPYPSVN